MKLKKKVRKSKTQNKVSRRFIQYNNPTDEYVYHITTPHRWNLIKRSNGLLGGLKNQTTETHKQGTEEGFLYVIDSPNKEEFDYLSWEIGIPVDPYVLDQPKTQHYVILGIRKDWLTKQGLVVEQDKYHNDHNEGCIPPGPIENHRQIFLGDRKIPLDQIRWFGNHRFPDPDEMDRRMFRYVSIKKNVPIEDVRLILNFTSGKSIPLDYGTCHHFNIFDRCMLEDIDLPNLGRLIGGGSLQTTETIKNISLDEYELIEDRLTRIRSIKGPIFFHKYKKVG